MMQFQTIVGYGRKPKSPIHKIRKHQDSKCRPTLMRKSSSKNLKTAKDDLKEVVKTLKVGLNSGNIKDQVKAVEGLLIILKRSKSINQEATLRYFLEADIAIFLSEAISGTNQFIELVFNGLVTLVTNKVWLNHRQIERIIDSSLRIISTAVVSHKGDALNWSLKLLVEIFQAAVDLGCSELLSNVVCITNVCKQLKSVFIYLKTEHESAINTIFTARKLLQIMINKSFFGYITNSPLLESLLEGKKECFQVLSEQVNGGKQTNYTSKTIFTAVLFMTDINLNHIKLCHFLQKGTNGLSAVDASLMLSKCTAALVDVAENIEYVIAPFMKNLPFDLADDSNLFMWKQFLECLHELFNSPFSDESSNLANILLICEYVELLSAIHRDSGENIRNISTLSMKCLGDILFRVSLEELNIACHFQPPFKAFEVHLRTGLKLFPRDPKQWLKVLSESSTPLCQQDAVIVVLYFLFKAKTKLNIAQLSGPHVCKNIVLRTSKKGASKGTSLPIVKALWLCLAIISRHSDNPLLDQASSGMVQLLSHHELLSVYSDHPSILSWIFSLGNIPKRLQEQVVIIFLLEESSNRNNIMIKVLLNTGVQPAFCLLRIAQNKETSPTMVDKVFYIFHKAFSQRGKSKLCHILWKLLPHSLKNAIANETAGITTNMLELACQCQNASDIDLDRDDALTLVDLLITACVMETQNPLPIVFYKAAIQVNLALLKFVSGRWMEDSAIVSSFFNNKFMHLLLQSISNRIDQDLCVESLKLISYLLWIEKKLKIRINPAPIYIEVKDLVRCLMFCDLKTSKATLQFTYMLIKAEDSSVITLQHETERIIHQLIRTLFYQVYNLYAKGTDKSTLHKTWICLSGLLNYASRRNKEVWLHIVTVPWFFQFLILFCTTAECVSENCIVFLEEWLKITKRSNTTVPTLQSNKGLDVMVRNRMKLRLKDSRKAITEEEKARALVNDVVSRKKVYCKSLQLESTNNVDIYEQDCDDYNLDN